MQVCQSEVATNAYFVLLINHFYLEISAHIDYDLYMGKALFCQSCLSNLAVPSRMHIFLFLRTSGPTTVTEIVRQMSLSQPTVSYHLKQMEESSLLSKKRVGRLIYYSVQEKCPNNQKACALKQINFNTTSLQGN